MQRVFLSHSSKDKESYVRIVSNRLVKNIGEENVILDEISFQPAMRTIEEIEENLNDTDLFVLFISENSIESEWVQQEIMRAKELWDEKKLSQIFPIIISENITYDNSMIPEWMRENYNLQYIKRPTKAAQIIEQQMIELSFVKHPRLKERNEIFVGRNELIGSFEERMDDFEKNKPVCMVASGIKSIGRKTLLKRCIFKCNIKKSTYPFPEIALNYDESIEDFILKIYDLGYEDDMNLDGLMTMPMEDKIKIATNFLQTIQKMSEILFIEDKGSIISQEGEVARWFAKVIESENINDKFCICVVSRYRLRFFAEDISYIARDRIFPMEVGELTKKERDGLLNRYLSFEGIELDLDDLRLISGLLTGFPEQVFFAVELIKTKGIQYLRDHTYEIVDYSNKKASLLIKEIEADEKKLSMLTLLSAFDYVSLKLISEIVSDDDSYLEYIDEFFAKSICEYVGVLKEYIRVNETVKDYVTRNNYEINPIHKANMDKNLKVFLNSVSMNEYDVPEYLFSLKEALIKGEKIDEKYIVPSLYLKTMTELYNNRKNKEVIEFADKALENEEYIDERIAFEIRYLLCSALAKLKNNRFKEEVCKIKGANFYFLYGFYYRQIGRFDKALEMLDKSMEERSNFSKAKREMVQVYIGMQEFQTAKDLAKENYLNYRDNPYHIQAYFSCLIKSEKTNENRDILKELISELEKINTDVAKEMTLRCKAQYGAFCDNNKEMALSMINQAIDLNPNIQYARIVKFDICEKFGMLDEMKHILAFFEQPDFKNKYMNNIICFRAVIMASEGNVDNAISLFKTSIRDYTEEAKDKFVMKLERYKEE